uniref:Uncharacterized protein n=1 Tax=Onchocerca volvulus TaxID=6282 RepID=A0A8R1U0L1_ONCVO
MPSAFGNENNWEEWRVIGKFRSGYQMNGDSGGPSETEPTMAIVIVGPSDSHSRLETTCCWTTRHCHRYS